jgi:hypothetical protein
MWVVFLFIGFIILGVIIAIVIQNGQTKVLNGFYPNSNIINANNYFVIDGDDFVLVPKFRVKDKSRHTIIGTINNVKIYEDGVEKSAGKAIVGGLTFGLVGALIGASMKTQYANNMGIKIYTDTGYYDINFLGTKTKKDSIVYKIASDNVDKLYSVILKHQNCHKVNISEG